MFTISYLPSPAPPSMATTHTIRTVGRIPAHYVTRKKTRGRQSNVVSHRAPPMHGEGEQKVCVCVCVCVCLTSCNINGYNDAPTVLYLYIV